MCLATQRKASLTLPPTPGGLVPRENEMAGEPCWAPMFDPALTWPGCSVGRAHAPSSSDEWEVRLLTSSSGEVWHWPWRPNTWPNRISFSPGADGDGMWWRSLEFLQLKSTKNHPSILFTSPNTPFKDSCWCMAKPIQYCKVISLQLNKFIIKKESAFHHAGRWQSVDLHKSKKIWILYILDTEGHIISY